jgi:hypothetical protein
MHLYIRNVTSLGRKQDEHFPANSQVEISFIQNEDFLRFPAALHCSFSFDMERCSRASVIRLGEGVGRVRNAIHQWHGLQAPQQQHQVDRVQEDHCP